MAHLAIPPSNVGVTVNAVARALAKALARHLSVVATYGLVPWVQLAWAQSLFFRGKYRSALRVFGHLASSFSMPEARKMEAWINFKMGNFEYGWPPYPGMAGDDSSQLEGSTRFKNPAKELERLGLREWRDSRQSQGNTLVWLDFDSSIGGEILCLTLFSQFQQQFEGTPILVVDTRLVGFAQRCFPGTRVLAKDVDCEQYAVVAESFILGRRLLRLVVSSEADFVGIRRHPIGKGWRTREADCGFSVGLSWKTTNARQGKYRNVPLKRLVGALREFPWTKVVVLQHGVTPFELKTLRTAFGARLVLSHPSGTIDRFAAEVAKVNYVVTVDNSVLHLAGSLGVVTFALLSKPSYWAWPESGESSRWFDSVTLIHQRRPRRWKEPVRVLGMKLGPLVSP